MKQAENALENEPDPEDEAIKRRGNQIGFP